MNNKVEKKRLTQAWKLYLSPRDYSGTTRQAFTGFIF